MQSQEEPVEILPDHIDAILRRMEEELKCAICLMPMTDPVSISCTHRFCRECILHNLKRKAACPLCNKKYDRRSLNTLDHMEKVINSFLSLKEIYEQEYGHDGSTETSTSKPTAKAPMTETITTTNVHEPEGQDTDEEATQVREHDSLSEHTPPRDRDDDTGSEHSIDIALACFDVDLDTVSEEEAAYLALQMLRAMSIVDTISEPREPMIKTENKDPRIDQTHSEPLGPGKSTTIETKPKLASSDDTFILTTTNLEISQKAVVERVAKAFNEKFIDELSSKPTHVVVKNGVLDSMEAGYWVQEDEYQLPDNEYGNSGQRRARTKKLQGEPPLFHGYEFQLFGTIQNLSKGDLEQLISAGGGVLVPELFRHDVKPRRRPEAAPQHHVLLFDPSNQGIMHLRKLRTEVAALQETASQLGKHLRVVKSQTLLDTIYQYDTDKLLDTELTAE
ncbi:hypothetical protein BGZ93_002367 [Podila epicladia]|nr:hypothetical protein BGZ93_002367 [Podila epicladia]